MMELEYETKALVAEPGNVLALESKHILAVYDKRSTVRGGQGSKDLEKS